MSELAQDLDFEIDVELSESPPSLSLDLGSGPAPAPGYTGVDLDSSAGPEGVVIRHDLWDGRRWPWEDGVIQRLRAWHVIEHIPHDRIYTGSREAKLERKSPGSVPVITRERYAVTQDAFFWFFDEAFRIAASGCRFELAWPDPSHSSADQDPTHCRRVPVSTLHYLSRIGRRALRVNHYPVACDWRVESVSRLGEASALDRYSSPEEAALHLESYHEIRAVLVKD